VRYEEAPMSPYVLYATIWFIVWVVCL